jgi:hypothetical protein
VETIGQRCRRRLTNYSPNIETGFLSSPSRAIPLEGVKFGWDGDDQVFELVTQLLLRVLPQVINNDGTNVFWVVDSKNKEVKI